MKPLTAEEIAELHGELDEVSWLLEPEHAEQASTLESRINILIAFRLLDEVERSRALLKRIEWEGPSLEGECPDCGGEAFVDAEDYGEDYAREENKRRGHEPGCELEALIGDAK